MAAFTTLQQSSLVQLYVGILGTTPTTAALNTYATIFASTSGTDAQKYDAVAAAMTASTAGQTKYPVFATAGQIADTMLGHLGLPGTAVGADGTSLKALAEGILSYPGVTVASFARALLNALNTNTFSGTDALSVAAATAKTAYGVSSTGVAGTTLKTAVDTALGIVSPIVEPVSKVFTTALDTLEGGAGNDTFTGTVRATSSQVESGDQVSGGAGTDTVALKMADKGGGSLDLKLTNVERVDLEMYSSLAMSGIDWTGVKTVVMGGPAGSLTLTDLSGPIDLELTGKDYGQNPVDRDLTATYRSLSGASDALSLSIANLTGVSAEIHQGTSEGIFESVAVSISQSGSGGTFGIFGSAFSGSTSFTVTGSDNEKMTLNLSSGQKVGNVTFTGTGSGSTVNISVGAISGSADQTLSFAAAGAPATYTIGQEGSKSLTGSPFNDSITVSSTGSGSVTGSLGGGNDTITVNSLPVGATGGHSIDGGDGNDSITIASNRNASVTGGDGADTITFSGTGSGNLVISAGSGADVLTITLAGQHSVDMGAGADTITAVSAVSSDDTIDGGLDSDYMSFSLAVQTTTPKISNVETLGVQFSTTGSRRLVGSDLNGVTEIRSTGSGTSAGQVYMTSMSGNMTLNFAEAAATGTNTIAFKEGADATLTLKGTGAAAATVFDLTNVQNLVVTTNSSNATNNWGSAGVVQINLDDVDTDTVTITGYGSASHTFELGRSSAVQSYVISHMGSGSTTVRPTGGAVLAGAVLLGSVSITTSASGNVTFNGGSSASGLSTLNITAGEQSAIVVDGASGNNAFNGPNTTISVASASTVTLDEFYYSSFLESSLSITSAGSGSNSIQFGSANGSINDFYTSVTLTGDAALKMGSGGAAAGLTLMSAAMTITTGSGADILLGGTDADTISSGAGNDSIFGGSGSDLINPGLGSDQIVPGAGADTIRMNNGSYTGTDLDRVSGFVSGSDVIDYSGSTALTKQTAAIYAMLLNGTAATASLFAASAGYEIWRYSGAQAYSVGGGSGLSSGLINFKTTTGFMLLFGGSAAGTGVDGVTSMFATAVLSSAIDGQSGYGAGFTGSGAAALILFEAGYSATDANGILNAGASTGTYVIGINYTGSGTATLTTANIVSQMFLAGVTGIAAGSFD